MVGREREVRDAVRDFLVQIGLAPTSDGYQWSPRARSTSEAQSSAGLLQ
jgi:hypothetical protein